MLADNMRSFGYAPMAGLAQEESGGEEMEYEQAFATGTDDAAILAEIAKYAPNEATRNAAAAKLAAQNRKMKTLLVVGACAAVAAYFMLKRR